MDRRPDEVNSIGSSDSVGVHRCRRGRAGRNPCEEDTLQSDRDVTQSRGRELGSRIAFPLSGSGDEGVRGYGSTVPLAVLQIRTLARFVGANGFVLLPFLGLRSDGVALRKGE